MEVAGKWLRNMMVTGKCCWEIPAVKQIIFAEMFFVEVEPP